MDSTGVISQLAGCCCSMCWDRLRVVQMLKRLLQEMSPRVLLRPKVQPQLLQLLLLLLGDTDSELAEEAKNALMVRA